MRSSRVRRVKRTARKSISRALSRMPRSKRSKSKRSKSKRSKRSLVEELRETLSLPELESDLGVSPKAWSAKLQGKGTKGKKGKKSHKKKHKKKKMKGGSAGRLLKNAERLDVLMGNVISATELLGAFEKVFEDPDEMFEKLKGLLRRTKGNPTVRIPHLLYHAGPNDGWYSYSIGREGARDHFIFKYNFDEEKMNMGKKDFPFSIEGLDELMGNVKSATELLEAFKKVYPDAAGHNKVVKLKGLLRRTKGNPTVRIPHLLYHAGPDDDGWYSYSIGTLGFPDHFKFKYNFNNNKMKTGSVDFHFDLDIPKKGQAAINSSESLSQYLTSIGEDLEELKTYLMKVKNGDKDIRTEAISDAGEGWFQFYYEKKLNFWYNLITETMNCQEGIPSKGDSYNFQLDIEASAAGSASAGEPGPPAGKPGPRIVNLGSSFRPGKPGPPAGIPPPSDD